MVASGISAVEPLASVIREASDIRGELIFQIFQILVNVELKQFVKDTKFGSDHRHGYSSG
jgi:hypothetical protein